MTRLIAQASLTLLIAASSVYAGTATLPVAGTWRLRLDPPNEGRTLGWAARRWDGDSIFLPGSLDEAGFGLKTAGPGHGHLSRPYIYEGAAWFQRDVVIPESWRGKRVTLFLERPHWQSEAWLDGRPLGSRNSLAVPHEHDLGVVEPGLHVLTICVDNTYEIDVSRNAHSVTEHTQTNWNGIVGRMELRATDRVWIEAVRVNPQDRFAELLVEIGNSTGRPVSGAIRASLAETAQSTSLNFDCPGDKVRVSLTLPVDKLGRWDEYEGALHDLRIELTSGALSDAWNGRLALREISTKDKQITLNGRPVFLRATLECNIFPRTGYPPMDLASWERLFAIARSYGLNSFRFHSWCPPEAAFEAADRAGFLLHVELPVWSDKVGQDEKLNEFMREEANRILRTYGNHPSFAMLCLGNELRPDWAFMDGLVADLKRSDNRRLYTFSADYQRKAAGDVADYFVAQSTTAGFLRIHGERFHGKSGGTDYDFSKHVAITRVPLVAHELGQWVVHPSFEEIGKYTGVLKARNLEMFHDQLAERGLAAQAREFQSASGRFAWEIYKEDIETALRTPHFGGVDLLQLQDFPGQGEALVGLLDSFWDSKGILTPKEFRQFFSETVPLLRFEKFMWTNNETFTAKAEVSHYGKRPIAGVTPEWLIEDARGKVVCSGRFSPANLPLGSVTSLGEVHCPLGEVRGAARLRVTVRIPGTEAENRWNIWVYPSEAAESAGEVMIARQFDNAVRGRLSGGGKVLLMPSGTLQMEFLPVFWSLSWFKKQPGTLGVFCDPSHAALATFPTDPHSDWQWFDLTEGARVFVLDRAPAGLKPIVQVIDDFHRGHKLGAVFEIRVGAGKLLVSAFDLQSDLEHRPAARQMRNSLLAYMKSGNFQPALELDASLLNSLLQNAESR